jgi:hypothetical protein
MTAGPVVRPCLPFHCSQVPRWLEKPTKRSTASARLGLALKLYHLRREFDWDNSSAEGRLHAAPMRYPIHELQDGK